MKKDNKKMHTETADKMFDIIAKSKIETEKKRKKKSSLPKTDKDFEDLFGDNTLELVESDKQLKAKTIGWNDLKVKRKFQNLPVELWNNLHIFYYMRQSYSKKNRIYKEQIDSCIGLARRDIFIKELFKKFEVYVGTKVDNVMIKQYIDYYVNQELENQVAAKGAFNIYSLLHRQNIMKFHKKFNLAALDLDDNVPNEIEKFNTIEKVYDTGGVNLLVQYGVVIPFVWLVTKKNLDGEEASKVIERFLRDANAEGPLIAETILKVTVQLSPYPINYVSNHLESLLNKNKLVNVKFDLSGKKYL